MSESRERLRRIISRAHELQSVVRSMKSLAAASISQYEEAVRALEGYWHALRLAWGVVLPRESPDSGREASSGRKPRACAAVVFGSDQGLVGSFNEHAAKLTVGLVRDRPPARSWTVWAVGGRVESQLGDEGVTVHQVLEVPQATAGLAVLVTDLLLELETWQRQGDLATGEVFVVHNRPTTGAAYETVAQRLLPLDETWRQSLRETRWPTKQRPEILQDDAATLLALLDEYLFVSLYQAAAQSLASENAARLAAMQRAERNIEDQLEQWLRDYHRLRQSAIDEELFDLLAGEA